MNEIFKSFGVSSPFWQSVDDLLQSLSLFKTFGVDSSCLLIVGLFFLFYQGMKVFYFMPFLKLFLQREEASKNALELAKELQIQQQKDLENYQQALQVYQKNKKMDHETKIAQLKLNYEKNFAQAQQELRDIIQEKLALAMQEEEALVQKINQQVDPMCQLLLHKLGEKE